MHVVGVSSLAAGHLTLVPAAQGGAGRARPRRHPDRRRRRHPAAGLRRPARGRRGGDLPARHGDRRRRHRAARRAALGVLAAVAAAAVDLDAYEAGVRAADRTTLGRAITLVESTHRDHQELAQELLTRLLPKAGGAHRVGITGVPGAGKSTFIDALGSDLTASGNRVAVLAIDPSSTRTGGSILGDKTRMARLAVDEPAFIRPSPSSGVLGGVARATRETIVCRGRRLRRRARRDRRRRSVRDHGRQHGRLVPGADAGRRRRQPAGHQEGRARARRRDRRQQGRRRPRARRQGRGAASWPARCT